MKAAIIARRDSEYYRGCKYWVINPKSRRIILERKVRIPKCDAWADDEVVNRVQSRIIKKDLMGIRPDIEFGKVVYIW